MLAAGLKYMYYVVTYGVDGTLLQRREREMCPTPTRHLPATRVLVATKGEGEGEGEGILVSHYAQHPWLC